MTVHDVVVDKVIGADSFSDYQESKSVIIKIV